VFVVSLATVVYPAKSSHKTTALMNKILFITGKNTKEDLKCSFWRAENWKNTNFDWVSTFKINMTSLLKTMNTQDIH
jgi:hypothetical protein